MSQHAKSQAVAQLLSILDMVNAYLDQGGNYDSLTAILESPLEVTWRSGWTSQREKPAPEEFCILLCTGGPAVRLVGDYESRAWEIEYQDRGTPWTELPWHEFISDPQLTHAPEQVLLRSVVDDLLSTYLDILLCAPDWS